MDTKAVTISLALIAITIMFVLAQSEVVISITTSIILALMIKGFVSMWKEVRAIMERGDLNDR